MRFLLTLLFPLVLIMFNTTPLPAADENSAVYELRTYIAPPGKLAELHARFRDHTCRLFTKHGMTMVGYWTPTDGDDAANTLIYVLAHKSREAATESWKGFRSDPDWIAAKTASEANGKLTEKVMSVFMKATDYSPLK
jgi:hypothetical protein